MERWSGFAEQAPELAAAGEALLYQHGPGLGYLATLRPDGAPRLHPVCPHVHDGGLYVFIGHGSPKRTDLLRDGRCSVHTFPADDVDDEFMVAGAARPVDDDDLYGRVLDVYLAQGTTTTDDTLFELLVDRALHAAYGPRPSWPPTYARWRAG